jgi:hypothetical protein
MQETTMGKFIHDGQPVDAVTLSMDVWGKYMESDYEGQRICQEQALQMGVHVHVHLLADIYRYNKHKGGYNFPRAADLYIIHGKRNWNKFAGLGEDFVYNGETDEILTLLMYRFWASELEYKINNVLILDTNELYELVDASDALVSLLPMLKEKFIVAISSKIRHAIAQ